MIHLSGLVLLVPLGAIGVILFLVALTHLWHAVRHGGFGPTSMISGAVFAAGLLVVAWAAWTLLQPVDWAAGFDLALPGAAASLTP